MDDMETVIRAGFGAYTPEFVADVCTTSAIASTAGSLDPAAILEELRGREPNLADTLSWALDQTSDQAETLRRLGELTPDQAWAWHVELYALEYPAEHAGHAIEEDPGIWQDFLAQYGPAWDGTPEGWPVFSEWFAYHGNEAGVPGFAQQFLVYVAGDWSAYAEYGFEPAAQAAADEAYEPAAEEWEAEPAAEEEVDIDLTAMFDEDELADLTAEIAGYSEEQLADLIQAVEGLIAARPASE